MNKEKNELNLLLNKVFQKMDYQKYLTPINFSEENGLFLKNYREKKVYNPQYKYYKFCAENIYDTFHILENLVLDNCKDNNIFRESIDKLDCELKMYENIGDDEKFSESSIYAKKTFVR